MRLETGIRVPDFSVVDLEGNTLDPDAFRGKRWWLILSRFVSCPFCSLRLRRVIERHESIEASGLEVLVVFPSHEKRVRQFARKFEPKFHLAADPEQKVFSAFGSETSWAGEMRTAINVPKVLMALVRTKMNPFAVDDKIHRMPSEYLINPDGIIDQVHYGEEMDDGMAVDMVVAWATGNLPTNAESARGA